MIQYTLFPLGKQTMSLVLYNSLTKKKDVFTSIETKRVRMYSCGPTVYNTPHIGNYRSFLFSDILHRFLLAQDYSVTLIMNITDIDNKTIAGAQAAGKSLKAYTEGYTKEFLADLKMLNFLPAAEYPCASDHIPEMVTMIESLLAKGHAYRDEDSIYFRLESFSDYGKLSGIEPSQQLAGASTRITEDEYSRETISDFALWKAYKAEEDGDVFYQTDIGKGRPGWHIECSAMSQKYLGDHFDIHTGGIDNKFPHHENEIAQSVCATGEAFVNYWLHAGHLMVEGEKMSKSLGNVYSLEDLKARGASAMTIRYMLLSTHYRSTYNFTFENVQAASKGLSRLARMLKRLIDLNEAYPTSSSPTQEKTPPSHDPLLAEIEARQSAFTECLSDDLNTSGALGEWFELTHSLNTHIEEKTLSLKATAAALRFYRYADSIFGFALETLHPDEDQDLVETEIPEEVLALLAKRNAARDQRDFNQADVLRAEIIHQGYQIIDTPEKTILRKNNTSTPQSD